MLIHMHTLTASKCDVGVLGEKKLITLIFPYAINSLWPAWELPWELPTISQSYGGNVTATTYF